MAWNVEFDAAAADEFRHLDCSIQLRLQFELLKRMTREPTRGHCEEVGQDFGDFVLEATA